VGTRDSDAPDVDDLDAGWGPEGESAGEDDAEPVAADAPGPAPEAGKLHAPRGTRRERARAEALARKAKKKARAEAIAAKQKPKKRAKRRDADEPSTDDAEASTPRVSSAVRGRTRRRRVAPATVLGTIVAVLLVMGGVVFWMRR
jgi:hypothetical protein